MAVAAATGAAAGVEFPFCPACARVKPHAQSKAASDKANMILAGEAMVELREYEPRQNLRTFIADTSSSLGEKPNTNNRLRTQQPGVNLRRGLIAPGMCCSMNRKAKAARTKAGKRPDR